MRNGTNYKHPEPGLVFVLNLVACFQEMLHETFAVPYEAVEVIFRELTSVYKDNDIDWRLIHEAGCTRDDTDLPDHITKPNDLERLIGGTFALFLSALPVEPTIITIAREILYLD
ncbi:hypothetical protein HZH68_002122 [Vespula germanica]|uniref:Uncharacterized protein n=1 Tax=Vespula germanica TaxID=30212 RepID=A0A834KVH7_VESGE|nr:hypothetical protein HZH68_002122 [Vespula germanica]